MPSAARYLRKGIDNVPLDREAAAELRVRGRREDAHSHPAEFSFRVAATRCHVSSLPTDMGRSVSLIASSVTETAFTSCRHNEGVPGVSIRVRRDIRERRQAAQIEPGLLQQ